MFYWVVRLRSNAGNDQHTYSRSHAIGTDAEFLEDAFNHYSDSHHVPVGNITIANYDPNAPHPQGTVI